MKLGSVPEVTRTVYYSLLIIGIVGGVGLWVWKQAFPGNDFLVSYVQAKNVWPKELDEALKGSKLSTYPLHEYLSMSITNVTAGRLEDVAIQIPGDGYAQIRNVDGKENDLTTFKDRLPVGDLPADATVSVNIWKTYFEWGGKSTVTHSRGKQVVIANPYEFSIWKVVSLLFYCILGGTVFWLCIQGLWKVIADMQASTKRRKELYQTLKELTS